MAADPILVFIDLETSGGDEDRHELLEVACVMVDPVTGEVHGEPGDDEFTRVIDPDVGDWPDRMPDVVRTMHEASGLLRDVSLRGIARRVAGARLAGWIDEGRPPHRPLWLAGAGVSHFESRWLPRHLPHVAGLVLDYEAGCRVIDTSATRRHLELAGVACPAFNDRKPHRALPDVWLHVAEYRWQRALFSRLAEAPDVVAAVSVWDPFGDGVPPGVVR